MLQQCQRRCAAIARNAVICQDILQRFEDGSFDLEDKKGDSNKSFSYHLYIKNLIEQAIAKNEVQRYHFTLLRNLYEKTALSFCEFGKCSMHLTPSVTSFTHFF